ncbi:modifier of mdg4, partial [Drosophila tropicalis]|uniref:modifier of mdg4 n=1 Tax=Drosophila tropicalis TaxID=46794 RepID=UPI0035AB9871
FPQITVATLPPAPRKRGRPKTKLPENAAAPKPKLIDKLRAATQNKAASEPAVYASTTKGGVKLYFDGHLFRFSFRKADFSVFQCCYREHGEECKVRVVCDQKRVFPYDGEHAHFMQASDKSCLPSQFMPGESGAIAAMEKNKGQKVEFVVQQDSKAKEEPNNDSNDDAEDGEETEFELHEIEDVDVDVEQTSEKSFLQDIGKIAPEEDNNTTSLSADAPVVDEVNPNDFREKIKRRLQRALQNKKK